MFHLKKYAPNGLPRLICTVANTKKIKTKVVLFNDCERVERERERKTTGSVNNCLVEEIECRR